MNKLRNARLIRKTDRMKILVTGANGFLGTNLVRELIKAGLTVRAFVRPSAKLDSLKDLPCEIFRGDIISPGEVAEGLRECDAVIHSASTTSVKPLPFDYYKKVNVDATDNIIRQVLLQQNKRLVYVGTANAFAPGSKSHPGDERKPFPLHLGNEYIKSKRMAQELVLKNVRQNNLNAVIVNPTFMIGPYDSKPSSGKLILMALKKGIQWCPPGGKNFVAVTDVAKGIHKALRLGKQGECYLLAGENLTYREFFAQVNDHVERKRITISVPLGLLFLGGVGGDVWNKVSERKIALSTGNVRLISLDNYYSAHKAKRELRFTPTPVMYAVKEAIEWFKKENYVSDDYYSVQGTNFDL